MLSLFGLSMIVQGLLNSKDSNIVSRVSLVPFAVKAIKRQAGSNDLNSCNFEEPQSKSSMLLGWFEMSPCKHKDMY